ncbi:hypothetical protein HYW21_04290, partial [Candidatus Woesearchaeota archaeon]|nr:hypothetical protein [Candidatus Woesearchaeota archaeon]
MKRDHNNKKGEKTQVEQKKKGMTPTYWMQYVIAALILVVALELMITETPNNRREGLSTDSPEKQERIERTNFFAKAVHILTSVVEEAFPLKEKSFGTDDEGTDDPNAPAGDSLPELRYPMLRANIFSNLDNNSGCYLALSAYEGITTGGVVSSKINGGYDYGRLWGFGSHAGQVYDVGNNGISKQEIWKEAKVLNPNLKIFSHKSLKEEETANFGFSANNPLRWFADSLSPRWFAYTPLTQLQEAVSSDGSVNQFKFPITDINPTVLADLGAYTNGPAEYWNEGNKYDWIYFSFFDNDLGGGRGTVEIMAVKEITFTADYGIITVSYKEGTTDRTVYGEPQSYAVGDRAGFISSSSPGFGSLVFKMNLYCRKDLEATTNCNQLRVDSFSGTTVNWPEAASDYVSYFLVPAAFEGVYLNDGVIYDADGELQRDYGFRFSGSSPSEYRLDQDLDGNVDAFADVEFQLYPIYEEYSGLIKQKASDQGRPEFAVMVNGYLVPGPDPSNPLPHLTTNGRNYEDFNGNFQGTYLESLEQYRQTHYNPNFLAQPVYSFISERDRDYYEGGQYYQGHINSNNWEDHRNIMAMTLVFGDGYYGHTWSHATGIPTCVLDLESKGNEDVGPRDDWFDEFSVDPYGFSAKHPLYSGEILCYNHSQSGIICGANRAQYLKWLGKETKTIYNLSSQGYSDVYRRDFEKGIALISLDNENRTINIEPGYARIIGIDQDNKGNLYNDGYPVTTLNLSPQGGIILRKVRNDTTTISLMQPMNNSFHRADGGVSISCNAQSYYGTKNISLYTNITGTWEIYTTQNSDELSLTLTGLLPGRYIWNCLSAETYDTLFWGNEN